MIFTTRNKEFAILGNTIDEIKKKWDDFTKNLKTGNLFGENGAFASLFTGKTTNNILTPAVLSQFEEFKEKFNNSSLSAEALAEQMKNVDQRIIDYAKTCKNGKLTTEGFKASIEGMSFSAKAGKIALSALATAGNMIAFTLISEGISLAVKKFDEYIHAAEIAREKSTDMTDSWVSENDSINNSISKYEELRKKLNDTSLSASEVESAKRDLLEVQNDLIDKYGQEALGIDLVNGKYDEQITKLKELSTQKAQEYVAKNYANIKEDEKNINEKINLNKSLGFGGTQARPDDYSDSGFDLGKYLKRYDKLDAKVTEPIGQYGMSGTVNLVTNGTREEVYDQLTQLFNDLSHDFGESNENVNKFKATLSGIMQDSFDTEQINKSKNNIKKYAEAEILSQNNTRKLYEDATAAVNEYNNALNSGKDIDNAKKNLDNIKSKVDIAISDISGAKYVFDDIYGKINSTAEKSYEITKKLENDTSIKAIAEQLKSFSNDDLSNIDFEDKIEQPGEKALTALINAIGISKDEVQLLIDKVAELGYLQSSYSSTNTTPLSFKNAWNALGTTGTEEEKNAALEAKEELLELAKAGKLTPEVLENNEALATLLQSVSNNANIAADQINKMVKASDQLSAMKTGITAITSVYDEKKDSQDHRVGTDTLNSLRNTLGIDDSWSEKDLQVWKDYKDAATDTGTSLKDFKKCQDALASSYVNSNNFLSQLNGTNKDYYISTLREMGVDNASAVVKQILAQKISQENQDKINLALSTINLSDGIQNNELLALSNEVAWLATASEATKQYYLQKLLANENSLNSSDSIANLKSLAEQAGITSTTISELTTLLQMQRMYESMAENVKSTRDLETLKKQIEKQKEVVINSANRKPKTKVETTKGNKSGNKNTNLPKNNNNPKEPKETKQSFDWLERKVTVLTDKLDLLKAKIENVFSISEKTASLTRKSKRQMPSSMPIKSRQRYISNRPISPPEQRKRNPGKTKQN